MILTNKNIYIGDKEVNRIYYNSDNIYSLFTPTDITTSLWLDASDSDTITESGGAVSQWADKSGNGNDFSQGTGVNQPVTNSRTINGLNAIDFNGTKHFLNGGDILDLNADDLNILTVAKFDSFNTISTIIAKSKAAVGSGRWGTIVESGILTSLLELSSAVNSLTSFSDTNANMINTFIDRDVSNIISLNGNDSTTTAINDIVNYDTSFECFIGAYPSSLGSTPPFTNSYLDGLISEVIVVKGTLNLSDRQKLEGYLAWKWGLVDNLPVGHPYKTVKPTV